MDPLSTIPLSTRTLSSSSSQGRLPQAPLSGAGSQLPQLLTRTTSTGGIGGIPYVGRRHSIYGTEDRIVLDIGSLYLKCGFSGESQPRYIIPVSGDLAFHRDHPCNESCRKQSRFAELLTPNDAQKDQEVLEETLRYYLYDVFYRYLLTDSRQRKVIVCEPPLMQTAVKNMIARILFKHFQVPSVSFISSPLLSLMTAGVTTGIVLDCGHWETTVVPVFDQRPLMTSLVTSPLAGRALSGRLKMLLVRYAKIILPGRQYANLQPNMLNDAMIEDLKSRLLFVSPFNLIRPEDGPVPSQPEDDFEGRYKDASAATDTICRIRRADTGEMCQILVPGWVRERAAEVLFTGDEDAYDIVCCLLECLLKLSADLRASVVGKVLLTGGTAMLPNLQSRLHQECIRLVNSVPRYQPLQTLMDRMIFLTGGERGRIFPANCRAWIGGK
jgi:actin-related protein 10